MAKKRESRGRLSSIDLLPPEANDAVDWAATELAKRERTQQAILEEFNDKLLAINPNIEKVSSSAFNRYSIRTATMTRRLVETHEIAKSLNQHFDANKSDNLTIMAAEAIKTLVFELLGDSGEAGMAAKDVTHLAAAIKQATQAQHISTDRRKQIESDTAKAAERAIDKVGRKKGLTKDTVNALKKGILGVDLSDDKTDH